MALSKEQTALLRKLGLATDFSTGMRTLNYDLTTGARCAATALVAKRATATLTSDPITGDSGEPIKLSGTVTITGDWEYGTYDTTTKKFTPKAA